MYFCLFPGYLDRIYYLTTFFFACTLPGLAKHQVGPINQTIQTYKIEQEELK